MGLRVWSRREFFNKKIILKNLGRFNPLLPMYIETHIFIHPLIVNFIFVALGTEDDGTYNFLVCFHYLIILKVKVIIRINSAMYINRYVQSHHDKYTVKL